MRRGAINAMPKLYEKLVKDLSNAAEFSPILALYGKGTEFEAVSRVEMDEEDGQWYGYMIFKDERFSPSEAELPGFQLKYFTPSAANGVCAEGRARDYWETLVNVFKGLMGKSNG